MINKTFKLFNEIRSYEKKNNILVLSILVCLAAALTVVCLKTGFADGSGSCIVINEVVSCNSSSLADGKLGSPDWIELYNPSEHDVNLAGYILTDKDASTGYVFNNTVISANGYITVYAAEGTSGNGACCTGFGISKKGENLYLYNSRGVVECLVYIPSLCADVSYARRSDDTYGYCTVPTPGTENDDLFVINELTSLTGKGQLVINEVLPQGIDECSWLELYNPSDTREYLSGYYLTDNAGDAFKWRLPECCLEPGGYAVIYFSGENECSGDMIAPFDLRKNDTAVFLYNSAEKLVSSLSWSANIVGGISVLSDGSYTAHPTQGEANTAETFDYSAPASMNSSDHVRISEVLIKNEYGITDENGKYFGWAELSNASDNDMSLKGFYLSDDENTLLKWALPDVKIEAGGYIIVFLSGGQTGDDGLHTSFRLSEGETLFLTNIDGMRVDSITMPEEIGRDISVGCAEGGEILYFAQPTPGTQNSEKTLSAYSRSGFFVREGVFISEVCAASEATGGGNDWIEIYNGSDRTVDLSGFYLSDDTGDIKKWSIPSLTINSGGYAVIEASPDAGEDSNIANFGISPCGETLLLADTEGNVIDVFDTGILSAGITSGRIESDNTVCRVFFDTPTKNKLNSDIYYYAYTAVPVFSKTCLYCTEAFELTITCTTADATIYYTTDGSEPTNNSKVYSSPIRITENTAVRAVAYADGLLRGDSAASTYIFDDPHTIPVVCISGKSGDIRYLLDSDTNKKPEYEVYVEYYEQDGTLGVSFPSGIRPKGKSSLRLPQNSLTLFLRNSYGRKSVTYPFFPDSLINEFTTLTLRSGGQDSTAAKIRDSFFQAVSRELNLDTIYTRPVVVYANGQYCGLYELEEEQNEDYLNSYYGVDTDYIDIIKQGRTALKGDIREYKNVCEMACEWDLSDDEVFLEFAKYVDVDACTDYLAMQIYFGNGDVVNQKFWRTCDYSVKWRPLLFDLDYDLRYNDVNRNTFNRYLIPNPSLGGVDLEGNQLTTEMYIFCGLKKNAAWRDKFIQRYIELSQTQFSTDRILAIYDEMTEAMRPEMQRHIAKWGTPKSMAYWESEISKLRKALEGRQTVALKQLKQYFHISDEKMQEYIAKYSKVN